MISYSSTWSPQAHLHKAGMLWFMSDINQLSLLTPFYSVLVYFTLYGPFNCISFHKFSQQLCFLTLFFWSYLCLIGPFNYISLYESLLQP